MTKDMKRCPDCKKILPVKEFAKDKYTKSGLKGYCKKCANKKRVNWERNNPKEYVISVRKAYLKSQYGLTLEQYDQMLDEQKGVCAICGQLEVAKDKYGGVRRLAVDHDHETGKIRMLLCRNCNTLMGCAKDNITILQSAINYLHDNRS